MSSVKTDDVHSSKTNNNGSGNDIHPSPAPTENQAVLEASPTVIAADPVAAENFNIEKSFLFSKMEEAAEDLPGTAASSSNEPKLGPDKDDFDWLGDDKDLYDLSKGLYTGPPITLNSKTSLYDNAQPNNRLSMRFAEEEDRSDGGADDVRVFHRLLPRRLFHVLFLTLQLVLISVATLGLVGHSVGQLAQVPLHIWSLFGLVTILIPLLSSWFLQVLVKKMRHSRVFEGAELPNFIDSLKGPAVLLTVTVCSGAFWYNYFPRKCGPSQPNPLVGWCLYELADRVFQALLLVSFGFAAEMAVMFYATLRFHERAFKDRIIKCRFKIYIIQQMALKALNAQRQRYLNRAPALSSAAELSFPGEGMEVDTDMDTDMAMNVDTRDEEDASYLNELGDFLKYSWRKIGCLWRGSRRVLDSAANYVQIQVDDQEATVPVPLASSQSYSRFSTRLKRHMQLYGYEQFAHNTSGLKDYESRMLARDLFHFLCPAGRSHLVPDDFSSCFANTQAARDALAVFDSDGDGQVSKKEFRNTIVSIYAELRDLTKSIRVAGSALKKLDLILKAAVVAFILLMVLALFSVNVTNLLTFSLSVVIGLNFVFGDLAKNFLHSIVFLFVRHPFDIGDTIIVGLFEEGVYLSDILTVKHIELMTTVFSRWNGQETYIPNHMLANAPFLTNMSRSVEQWEKIDFGVPITTPESRLAEMRTRIGAFLQAHEADFYRVFDLHAVVAADLGNSEKNLDELEFTLRVRCKPTSDSQKRWSRHARLLRFVKVTLLEGFICD